MNSTLRAEGVSLRFGDLVALDRVDLTLRSGELHALLGANGAGKSSLVRVLLGLERPASGEILLDDRTQRWTGPQDAARAGIGVVHQHFSLIDAFDVTENLLLFESRKSWSRRNARRWAREILERHHCPLRPDQRVCDLSAGQRQLLEITRALQHAQRFLILDEPTASLAPREIDALFARLEALKARGLGILLVTHHLDEVERACDVITVLREGRVRAHGPRAHLPPAELARLLAGADLPPTPPRSDPEKTLRRPPMLLARALRTPSLGPIDLELRGHEIVAVTGIEEHGQEALISALLGRTALTGGSLENYHRAIALIEGDRHRGGLALDLTVAENTVLHRGHLEGSWLSNRRVEERAQALLRGYALQASSLAQPVTELSGGNQQKVVIARELGLEPDLLIADNPTRGLDLATTHFVRTKLRELRDRGGSVLLFSTDLDEVTELADRVWVMDRGRLLPAPNTREGIASVIASDAAGAAS